MSGNYGDYCERAESVYAMKAARDICDIPPEYALSVACKWTA